ncbi:MAG: type II toxin-antitoxin system VapC family toxin [bacterium]|nr:type II toxin-antitoxin system VapC family toxin [bacterium]
MTTPVYVLDTHALIWHLQGSDSLSPKARSILDDVDAGKATAIVPSIVLVEMVYLAEKNRIGPESLDAALRCFREGDENYQLAPLDLAVTEGLRQLSRATVPDMPDRIIAATAFALDLPLLSTDAKIAALDEIEVVW